MDELANYRRVKKKRKYAEDFPKGILDVIETDYPDKYGIMAEDPARTKVLFSNEEWIDILTKSRESYESHIRQIKKKKDL